MEINATNHWSRRPWISCEELDSITIYTDAEEQLFTLERRTADSEKLAEYIITLHNSLIPNL